MKQAKVATGAKPKKPRAKKKAQPKVKVGRPTQTINPLRLLGATIRDINQSDPHIKEIASIHEAGHTVLAMIFETLSEGNLLWFDYVDIRDDIQGGEFIGGRTRYTHSPDITDLQLDLIGLAGPVCVQHIKKRFDFWGGAYVDVMNCKFKTQDDIWQVMSVLDFLFAMDDIKSIINQIATRLEREESLTGNTVREIVYSNPAFKVIVADLAAKAEAATAATVAKATVATAAVA